MKKALYPLLNILLNFSSFLSVSLAIDTITRDSPLIYPDTLNSPDGIFKLGFFTGGNSSYWYLGIWYTQTPQTIIWVANRDNPMPDPNGVLSINGNSSNLQIKTNSSNYVFSFASPSMISPIAQLLDTGNFVLKENNTNEASWQSFDYPTDTLLPGMSFGWIAGQNHKLTSWTGPLNPASSNYTINMIQSQLPEIIISNGTKLVFRTGLLDGGQFTGSPEFEKDTDFTLQYISNQKETYINIEGPSRSWLRLNNSYLQRYVQLDSDWEQHWSVPSDACDYYATCGQHAVCHLNSSNHKNCTCLNKFKPICDSDWQNGQGDTSYGCQRQVGLDHNEKDGFLSICNVKLPDTTNVTVHSKIGLKECNKRCLRNPNCTAYSNLNRKHGCAMWMDNFTDIRQLNDGGWTLHYRVAGSELPG